MYVSDVYSIQASRGHREIAHCRKDGREISLGEGGAVLGVEVGSCPGRWWSWC